MSALLTGTDGPPVEIINPDGLSQVVLVCEHASNWLPKALGDLGLDCTLLQSHIAWDPGAYAIAKSLSSCLNAPLVSANFSRLAYDVNRPPESPDAIRETSENHTVPGNRNLSNQQRSQRVSGVYEPFHQALAKLLDNRNRLDPVLITVHSFTPVYFGQARETELGILHDKDARLADMLIDLAPVHTSLRTDRNKPYGPEHGVTHTLQKHALPNGYPNAMLELRNDLITSAEQQETVAGELGALIQGVLVHMEKSDAA